MAAAPWENMAPIRVGAPNLGDRAQLHRRLDEILDRAWLTNHGPIERELEGRLCEVTGTRHCIPTSSATLGLLVSMRALIPEGEVLMPSFTFPALAHAARLIGLRPVFVDIDPHHHHIDPGVVVDGITDDTAGLVGVHLWGRSCDTAKLDAVMDGRPVLYDAAQAFGATHDGAPVGGNGRCEVFSFHATKFVNAFEGGAIATDDDDLAAELRLLVNFGFAGRDDVAAIGLNAKLSEIHAAMAIVSLDAMPRVAEVNRAHLEQYRARLATIPGIELRTADDGGNLSYVVVEVDPDGAGCTRDQVMERLRHVNIDTRRYFSPGVHRSPVYRGDECPPLPVTEVVCDRVLQLPTGTAITHNDVDRVCNALERMVGDP